MRLWTVLILSGASSMQVLAHAPVARAQNPDLHSILECRDIEDDGARLACFDRTTQPLSERAGDLIVVDRQELEAVERDGFGLELPSLPRLSLSIFANRGANELEVADSPATAPAQTQAAPAVEPAPDAQVLERTNDGQIDRIRLQVASVERRGYNDIFFTMTNGQVWERVSGPSMRGLPNPDRREVFVEIRRGAVGSYLMQIDGSSAAHRVQRRQ